MPHAGCLPPCPYLPVLIGRGVPHSAQWFALQTVGGKGAALDLRTFEKVRSKLLIWLAGYDIMMFGLLVLLGLLTLPKLLGLLVLSELLSLLSLPVLSGLLPKGDPADEILQ